MEAWLVFIGNGGGKNPNEVASKLLKGWTVTIKRVVLVVEVGSFWIEVEGLVFTVEEVGIQVSRKLTDLSW